MAPGSGRGSLWEARQKGHGGAANSERGWVRHAPRSRRGMHRVGWGRPPEPGPGADKSECSALAPSRALARGVRQKQGRTGGARDRGSRVRDWAAVGERGCCGWRGTGAEGACETGGGHRHKWAICNSRCARPGGRDAGTGAGGPGRGPKGDPKARRRVDGPRGPGNPQPLTIQARAYHPAQQDGIDDNPAGPWHPPTGSLYPHPPQPIWPRASKGSTIRATLTSSQHRTR